MSESESAPAVTGWFHSVTLSFIASSGMEPHFAPSAAEATRNCGGALRLRWSRQHRHCFDWNGKCREGGREGGMRGGRDAVQGQLMRTELFVIDCTNKAEHL